ncbi:MAG: hypothetical protein KGR98_07400, partial [Verrucomicrobia bacterium]|nr:hypothetical protein [Verrucomicrobiota bacterium]
MEPDEMARAVPLAPWQLFWRRLARRRLALAGGIILLCL